VPGRVGRRTRVETALVCAGGGVTGAVYEIGCLRAFEDLLDRSVLDLDLYVGISGGAFVASLLAAGVPPEDLYDAVVSQNPASLGVSDTTLFRFGAGDLLHRWSRAPRVLRRSLVTALTGEGRNLSDLALSLFELLPAGLLDNSGIQEFLARVLRSRGRRDRFDDMLRELYVVAVDLDTGEAVPFGKEGRKRIPVSRAVQASTALPGLYRPVRVGGRDYVDGGVKKTAHINLAIARGARLVLCVNPIVPILNDGRHGPLKGPLSDKGVTYVLDQVFRIMLYGRMQYGLERYRAEAPDVDILLIEPNRDDMRMFAYHIMRLGARRVVAEDGYRSVVLSFRKNRARYERILKRHGIRVRNPFSLPDVPPRRPLSSLVAQRLSGSLDRLARKLG
jgi:predicted acylesterase/phospholipase RssA